MSDDLDRTLEFRCGLKIRNRVALAPLTNLQSHDDGNLGDDELRWLERRAQGGFGLVSTCAAYVSDEAKAWSGQLGIATDEHASSLRRLSQSIGENGAKSIVQLYHGGAKATLAPDERLSTVDGSSTRGATPEDLERVVRDFVAAAERAESSGFDGVELHGANGYLFTQFLAPKDNTRTDRYGGDLEGRARFLLETLRAVRQSVRPAFAVGVRISPVDVWDQRGLTLDDGCQVSAWLADAGADFVHLSLSDAAGSPPHEPRRESVVRAIREAVSHDVPILAAGGIWTRDDAQRALAEGADVVVLGRAAIIHPDWPRDSHASNWTPTHPVWEPEPLRHARVGPAFLDYLRRFPGLVSDGAPPRDES